MNGASVLVVDDEESVRTSVAAILRSSGYEVIEAEDGERALQMLDRHDVQVVILDVRMPRLDGIGVLDALDEPPAVVLMSAHVLAADVRARIEEKVVSFLQKPVPPRRLLDEVAAAAGHAS
ncbi:MAG TPA: response regulator [Acidimicrobiales bacterium]|nr:response regulator [Acidimicrobiales bacterium]